MWIRRTLPCAIVVAAVGVALTLRHSQLLASAEKSAADAIHRAAAAEAEIAAAGAHDGPDFLAVLLASSRLEMWQVQRQPPIETALAPFLPDAAADDERDVDSYASAPPPAA